jgi:hypothetical protein
MFRRAKAFLLAGFLLSEQVSAATADWAAVQALAVGERIQVNLSTGKTLKGKLDHVTSESVFLQVDGRATEVLQKDVSRLYLKKRGSWQKSTVIGTSIGAAAGAGIGAVIMEKESGYGGAVAGTVALFAAIGASVGYAMRSGKSVLVYEAASRVR